VKDTTSNPRALSGIRAASSSFLVYTPSEFTFAFPRFRLPWRP
jgi:hypothetical protein